MSAAPALDKDLTAAARTATLPRYIEEACEFTVGWTGSLCPPRKSFSCPAGLLGPEDSPGLSSRGSWRTEAGCRVLRERRTARRTPRPRRTTRARASRPQARRRTRSSICSTITPCHSLMHVQTQSLTLSLTHSL